MPAGATRLRSSNGNGRPEVQVGRRTGPEMQVVDRQQAGAPRAFGRKGARRLDRLRELAEPGALGLAAVIGCATALPFRLTRGSAGVIGVGGMGDVGGMPRRGAVLHGHPAGRLEMAGIEQG